MLPSPESAARIRHLVLLIIGVAASPALAEDRAPIGRLEANLNGEARTWYIHAGGEVPGATWMEQGPGRYTATITGFESGGRMEGSQLTVSFQFARGDREADYTVSGTPRGPAAVRLMPAANDLPSVHTVREGQVTVNRIEAGDGVGYRFAGTFSGTLTNAEGDVVGELTRGRFQVERANKASPKVAPPPGSASPGTAP